MDLKRSCLGPANSVQPRFYTYFVAIRLGEVAPGAAGESTNVTHAFQPSGRFALSNSS
jgi:hypothetical protein